MKTRIPVVLALAAALALAACAPAQTADAPQNEQTAETAQNAGTAPAQETAALPAVAGELYALAEDGAQTCLFNAGDCGYQMLWQNDHGLVTVIDYAAAEQRVLCSVPGCDHASEDCPAYFPGIRHHYKLFAAGDAVYVYKQWAGEYMPATWEEYYETNLADTLAEDAQTFGQTPEEYLAWQRAVYRSSTDPASLMVITGGGAAKHIIELSQNLGADSALLWCDGAALYGYSGGLFREKTTGYRVSLADGSVTEFPLQENEWPCGVMGQNLLVDQFLTDAPLPDPDQNWEAYDAALQNGYYAFYLLDPATGVRTPLLVDRTIVSDTGFRGQAGGWLYFATMQRDDAGALTRIGLRAYDTATGQWQDHLIAYTGVPLKDRCWQEILNTSGEYIPKRISKKDFIERIIESGHGDKIERARSIDCFRRSLQNAVMNLDISDDAKVKVYHLIGNHIPKPEEYQ